MFKTTKNQQLIKIWNNNTIPIGTSAQASYLRYVPMGQGEQAEAPLDVEAMDPTGHA